MAIKFKEHLPGVKRRRKLAEARASISRSPAVTVKRISSYLAGILEPGTECPLQLDGQDYIIGHDLPASPRADYLRVYQLTETGSDDGVREHNINDVCLLPAKTSLPTRPDTPSSDFILSHGEAVIDQVRAFIGSEQYREQQLLRDQKLAAAKKEQELELTAERAQRDQQNKTRHQQAVRLSAKLDQLTSGVASSN